MEHGEEFDAVAGDDADRGLDRGTGACGDADAGQFQDWDGSGDVQQFGFVSGGHPYAGDLGPREGAVSGFFQAVEVAAGSCVGFGDLGCLGDGVGVDPGIDELERGFAGGRGDAPAAQDGHPGGESEVGGDAGRNGEDVAAGSAVGDPGFTGVAGGGEDVAPGRVPRHEVTAWDLPPRCRVADDGAAPFDAAHQTALFEQRHGGADGLSADGVLAHEVHLPGQCRPGTPLTGPDPGLHLLSDRLILDTRVHNSPS